MATNAAGEEIVNNKEDLQTAVANPDIDLVTLGTDIDNLTGELEIDHDLTLNLNGCNLKIEIKSSQNGIKIDDNAELIIDDSSKGNGILTISFDGDNTFGAAINVIEGGTLTIIDGQVFAYGGPNSAGIGGGNNGSVGNISITGGFVTAKGGQFGAGIGGGNNGSAGTISITGGFVTATSGQYGAGIGGGNNGSAGTISISGGTVTANGKTYAEVGIGSGNSYNGPSGTIVVSDYYNYRFVPDSDFEYGDFDYAFENNKTSDYVQLISGKYLSEITKERIEPLKAKVSFNSSYGGDYYYKVIEKSGNAPSFKDDFTKADAKMQEGENTFNNVDLLNENAQSIYIVGVSNDGLRSECLIIEIDPTPDTNVKPGGNTGGSTQPLVEPEEEPEVEAEEEIELPLHSVWAEPELKKAVKLGIIPPPLLKPEIDLRRQISRTEFAGVVVKVYENLAETTVEPIAENPFVDTQDEDALKAYNAGIMVGVSATEFSPDTELTREQAATALTRVFKGATIPGWTYETDSEFKLDFEQPELFDDDADISPWARESVYFMSANEIIRGIGNNLFAPRAVTSVQRATGYAIATREQAILMALRMVENLEIEQEIEQE
ncbi:MAG: S-layer homology domain-containing protein [Oscillospiraceae bacterium]|nr:S-layer homology domain-containing protein [Oscillospiraceae bacterium]